MPDRGGGQGGGGRGQGWAAFLALKGVEEQLLAVPCPVFSSLLTFILFQCPFANKLYSFGIPALSITISSAKKMEAAREPWEGRSPPRIHLEAEGLPPTPLGGSGFMTPACQRRGHAQQGAAEWWVGYWPRNGWLASPALVVWRCGFGAKGTGRPCHKGFSGPLSASARASCRLPRSCPAGQLIPSQPPCLVSSGCNNSNNNNA